MTIDNLASGLIGAVIGGVIVVWAEQWRWRRENRAAARLVYFEAINNRIILESLSGHFRGVAFGGRCGWRTRLVFLGL